MSSAMQASANKVADIIERYPSKKRMEKHLKECAAVAFYRIYRLGCIVTARHGTGILIAKLPKENAEDANEEQRWSAPAAVTISGLALAGAIGFEYTDFVMFLGTESLHAFYDGNSLGTTTNVCFAFGPFGSAAEAGGHTGNEAAMKMLGRSTGIYAGGSLEFSSLMFDRNSNRAQYGAEHANAKEMLTGKTAFPEGAAFSAMVKALNRQIASEPATAAPSKVIQKEPQQLNANDDVYMAQGDETDPETQGNDSVPVMQPDDKTVDIQADDVDSVEQAADKSSATMEDNVPASDKHITERVSLTDALLPKASQEVVTSAA
jgi:lipid-binding SYLF domain-containing protein